MNFGLQKFHVREMVCNLRNTFYLLNGGDKDEDPEDPSGCV